MRIIMVAGLLAASCVTHERATNGTVAPRQDPHEQGPTRHATWSFAVLGDNRDDPDDMFPSVVARIHDDAHYAFVLHLGDMVHSGGPPQLSGFLESSGPIRDCFFPVIGNHEVRRDGDRHAFKAAFGLNSTSYSFTYNDVHLVVVDNGSQDFSDGLLEWLRSDLDAHKKGVGGIEHIFVAMHIPPAGMGVKVHVEGDKAKRFEAGSKAALELLRAHAVDVVFAGHLHRAQILDAPGTPKLVISGAAGAPQGWTPPPHYGYHRVTVNGPDVKIEFVPVQKGDNTSLSPSRSRQETCPRIENMYAG